MKKAVSIAIANIILIVALTACGGKDGAVPSGNSDRQTGMEGQNEINAPEPGQITDEGGNATDTPDVPENAGEDEEALKRQYAATIFEALQNLDAEAMKPFVGDDYEDAVRVFDLIRGDAEDLEFWNNTIGNMVYLPDSDALITKSCIYVESKWYTDCWKNNEEPPASDSEDFSEEYLDEIYSRYYVDAPYVIRFEFAKKIISNWSDGAMCHLSSLTDAMGMGHFSFSLYEPNHLRAAILLNRAENYSLGYEYIRDGIPRYEDLLSKDLDKMMEIVDGYIDLEVTNPYSSEVRYKNYYMNDDVRAILQQFLDEECEVYRNLGTIKFFYPLDVDKIFPYSRMLTQEDKDTIKNMNAEFIYDAGSISDFPERLYNNFSVYTELIDCAKSLGLVE